MGSQGYDNISVMNDKCIGDTLQLDDNVYRITNVETGYLEDEEEENVIDINKNPIKYLPPVKQGNTVISS